jgi:23S rRNA (guanine745-N1)-methyltransferase
MNIPLACPLDGSPLAKRGNSAYCTQDHCFDFDKRGALNLLPVQFKKSLSPGDSKEMVAARTNFLDAGFYKAISDKLNNLVSNGVILDAGCGEGYYTSQLNGSVIGMDISKYAITEASKRSKDVTWIVGTNAKIPLLDASVDTVICLFGFPVWNEFARVLKPAGKVIMVDPAPEHLIELRRALYPEIHERDAGSSAAVTGFTLEKTERLTEKFSGITREYLADLLLMTPHGHRATKERKDALPAESLESMTLDMMFRIYCKGV